MKAKNQGKPDWLHRLKGEIKGLAQRGLQEQQRQQEFKKKEKI